MSVKSRVRSGFVLVALVGAGAVAVDAGVLAVSAQSAPRPAAAANCPAVHTQNPYKLVTRFISAVVERKDLRHSYALATPGLRHGVSCREWLKGHVPVPQVANIDWKRSGYRPVAGDSTQLVLRIFLAQPNAVLPASFLMELRQQPDGWHVGRFQREQSAPASPALAA
jgi:hypothetical protein